MMICLKRPFSHIGVHSLSLTGHKDMDTHTHTFFTRSVVQKGALCCAFGAAVGRLPVRLDSVSRVLTTKL